MVPTLGVLQEINLGPLAPHHPIEIIVGIEEKFGVTVPDDEAKNLKTVGDAVTFITSNQA